MILEVLVVWNLVTLFRVNTGLIPTEPVSINTAVNGIIPL
jgi:hypothetical protein